VHVAEASRFPGSRDIDDAAQIWAEATAARDGADDVAGLSLSRPLIEAVLDSSPASFVLIARSGDGGAAGFAAVAPVAGAGKTLAEVRYFGVRPGLWGRGVAELLLTELRSRLASAGFSGAQLLVYTDNSRAVTLYERLGWQTRGEPAPHPRTGKPEQRYEIQL
jgi:ribosomal protein S18 acetylase RimI-like enzyme